MSSLTFLHPWLLAGLLAASLPIIIHLIGKRRAPMVFFAAFDFLMAVNKRLARRERLRQILLLALRALALLALALAVARPLSARTQHATPVSRKVALILDASASMGYELEGVSLFSRAKGKARDLLSHLQPGDAATLIIAAAQPRSPFQAPVLELAKVRAAIESAELTDGTADMGAAIELALSQLGDAAAGATLFVVSDLAENSFRNVRPTALDPPPEVRLIDAAERDNPTALPNLAIEKVEVERGSDSPSERRIKVVLRNFGSEAVSGRTVELSIGGSVTQRGFVAVPPLGVQEKIFTHTFEGAGSFDGEVHLVADDDDGFVKDDVAYFGLDVLPGVRLLAVNGDPRTTPHEDELFFAERALAAIPRGDAPIHVRIAEPEELGSLDLAGFDVVLLANVGTLPPQQVARLGDFVAKGGGLLFALGDNVHFEQANDAFGSLLPHPLRDLHLAADPAAGTPPLGISEIDWDHPIVQSLGGIIEESLRASRTSRYFNLDVGAARKARAVLRFDNGAPALVEARRDGGGRVMLLTTSLDLDMSDLAIRSAYPAILQRTVRYLGRAVDGGGRVQAKTGEYVDLVTPTGAAAVALLGPDGDRLEEHPAGVSRVHLGPLATAGFWRAEVRVKDSWTRAPRLDVGVSPTLVESSFMPVRPVQVAQALGGAAEEGRGSIAVALGEAGEGDPFLSRGFASYLLLALAFFFVGESLLASRG